MGCIDCKWLVQSVVILQKSEMDMECGIDDEIKMIRACSFPGQNILLKEEDLLQDKCKIL